MVVFDVGANIGDYATLVHETFDGRADIHCFEPSAATFDRLQERCSTIARVNRFGLSDMQGRMTLYTNDDRSGLSSLYDRKLDHIDLKLAPSETVALRTVDDYCRDEKIVRIDLLKMDVEGHELAVLKGARALLDRDAIDCIQFEFGGCNIDSRTYFRDFCDVLQPRFRIYRILANGLWPIAHYAETLETFATTNYLAVRQGMLNDAL
ncbi:MAG: FkbM family methyltransferase [Acidobacteriota bacterium]|nr:FkbM family methyltransferase [Acidobacteriota bacterium]